MDHYVSVEAIFPSLTLSSIYVRASRNAQRHIAPVQAQKHFCTDIPFAQGPIEKHCDALCCIYGGR